MSFIILMFKKQSDIVCKLFPSFLRSFWLDYKAIRFCFCFFILDVFYNAAVAVIFFFSLQILSNTPPPSSSQGDNIEDECNKQLTTKQLNVLRKKQGMAFPRSLIPPDPSPLSLDRLSRSNVSSRAYTFKILRDRPELLISVPNLPHLLLSLQTKMTTLIFY